MPILTPSQIQEISQIIQDHHAAWIVNTIGPEVVPEDLLQRLKEKGLIDISVDSIKDAYLYGMVVAASEAPNAAGMSYAQFKEWIKKNPIPLTAIEQDAIEYARTRAGQYARGLGNRVDMQTGQILIEADAELRQRMRTEIMTSTEENLARRESIRKLRSDLAWSTKDWARDWGRIANTEKHFAMQRGSADYYSKEFGPDVQVAIREMPDACPHCVRLHGPYDNPKIFKLSELEANGTNVGRKVNEWLPVIPPVHPWCQGQLMRVPKNWGFNEEGQLVPNPKRETEKSLKPEESEVLGTPLVVPLRRGLQKGNITPSVQVRGQDVAHTMRADHRSPGQGTLGTHAMGLPDRVMIPPVEFPFEELRPSYAESKVVRDPEIYDVQEPFHPRVVNLVIPVDYRGYALGTGQTEENRAHFDDVRSRDRSVTRNTVEIEDSDQDDSETQ